jgi:hypothetical protein
MSELISPADRIKAEAKIEEIDMLIAQLTKRRADLKTVLTQKQSDTPTSTTSELQNLAEGLNWTPNSRGEYAFTTPKGSNETKPELRPLLGAINASSARKLVLGGFEYSLNGNPRFLSRRRA